MSLTNPSDLASLSEPELVRGAISRALCFKLAGLELATRSPSADAVALLLEAYREGRAAPWLTAWLLGCLRHASGYETARAILLAAPGQLAESYAGPAMAMMAGAAAEQDLVAILAEGAHRRTREGAAYGLAELGLAHLALCVLGAARQRRIGEDAAASVIAALAVDDPTLVAWLEGDDPVAAYVSVAAVFYRVTDTTRPAPGPTVARAVRHVLDAGSMFLTNVQRDRLSGWLARASHPA